MSFAADLRRMPRACDPDLGRAAADAVPDLPAPLRPLVEGAAGSSPYLARLVEREAAWLGEALAAPEAALEALLAPPRAGAGEVGAELRRAKGRLALLLALADLGGAWPLSRIMEALTRFADLAAQAALSAALEVELKRQKRDSAPPVVVIAMGKMGAFELNYSSDIDLICLFDESADGAARYAEGRTLAIRATRRMAALLSEITPEGYVFRTDLRLRPDPASTPVCLSMDAAERYYESVGRSWERAAWIKARAAAGAIEAGERFIERLRPFVWRRHLDFAAIEDAHDIRQRIREHRVRPGGQGLDGHDVKLGRGGIREIEFFTQTRQLIAGGRDPSLRVRGTEEGLLRLVDAGWVEAETAETLIGDYRVFREIEHRLQMVNDQQTHALPQDEAGWARLAAIADAEPAALRADLARRLDRVATLSEEFFAPQEDSRKGAAARPTAEERTFLERWEGYSALRSPRAIDAFERIRPGLLARIRAARRPAQALAHVDAFLQGLPAGVQIFALFEANPALVDLLVDIADTAPELARYLGRNAAVLDAVIGGDFFAPWPGAALLRAALEHRLTPIEDYEARLDEARRWQKEWHFRIGVHHLRDLASPEETSAHYADLADAVLSALWPIVCHAFSERHGPPPGEGAVALGMGSLGAGALTATSDLDLLVVYDAAGETASTGPRPLAARAYYARLTQALVTALTAPTAAGRLYEVDMRLRPSGRQGPVATGLEAFRRYQETEAWTWEHLALTRARPVAGAAALAERVEAVRRDVLAMPQDREKVLTDVAAMRERLFAAKGGGRWDLRTGPGRLQDIELFAQAAALLLGDPARDLPAQLGLLRAAGLASESGEASLRGAATVFRRVNLAARLMTGARLDDETAAAPLALRAGSAGSAEALAVAIETAAAEAEAVIAAGLAG